MNRCNSVTAVLTVSITMVSSSERTFGPFQSSLPLSQLIGTHNSIYRRIHYFHRQSSLSFLRPIVQSLNVPLPQRPSPQTPAHRAGETSPSPARHPVSVVVQQLHYSAALRQPGPALPLIDAARLSAAYRVQVWLTRQRGQ
jgi:hypothetical protein